MILLNILISFVLGAIFVYNLVLAKMETKYVTETRSNKFIVISIIALILYALIMFSVVFV